LSETILEKGNDILTNDEERIRQKGCEPLVYLEKTFMMCGSGYH